LSLYNHQLSQFQKNPDLNEWYASVMHTNETAKTFHEFVQTVTIPNLHNVNSASSTAYYAHFLKRWYQLFQPDQILVLSYQQDIRTNPKQAKMRMRQFMGLNLPITGPFPETNTHATNIKVKRMSCATRDQLYQIFEPWNQELYLLLANQSLGIAQPQRPPPFPQFTLPDCIPDDNALEESSS
jgi:Sulfotransferase domain